MEKVKEIEFVTEPEFGARPPGYKFDDVSRYPRHGNRGEEKKSLTCNERIFFSKSNKKQETGNKIPLRFTEERYEAEELENRALFQCIKPDGRRNIGNREACYAEQEYKTERERPSEIGVHEQLIHFFAELNACS